MDDDFNEFAPLLYPLSGKPFLIDGKQAKPDLLDLEDISPSRKLRSLVNSSKFLLRLFSDDFETRLSGVKKCGDPPFLADALPYLKKISNNPDENEKIRFTAMESIELIILSGSNEEKNKLIDRVNALKNLGDLKSLRAFARIDTFEKEINKTKAAEKITKKDLLFAHETIASVRKN